MEEFLAELIPVSEWEWWLWRVTWRDDVGRTKFMWCVSTDTHIDAEVERRWPSDHWTSCVWEPIEQVKAPRDMWCAALRRTYHEDAWDAGAREAARLQLNNVVA